MAQFSGAVKLADLNDFIAPSQACVVNANASGKAQVQLDFSDFDIRPEVSTHLSPPNASHELNTSASIRHVAAAVNAFDIDY